MHDDITQAAAELRQLAAELRAGHTIGEEWPEPEVKAEYDRLRALASRLEAARQPQERGEAVFYYRPRSDGLYEGPIHHSVIEPVRRNSEQWVPLYTHPTPDAGRVAELEARLTNERELFATASEVLTNVTAERDSLMAQLAETNKAYRSMVDANRAASERLAESREREGRMREAASQACDALEHQIERTINVQKFTDMETREAQVILSQIRAALAAEKEGE